MLWTPRRETRSVIVWIHPPEAATSHTARRKTISVLERNANRKSTNSHHDNNSNSNTDSHNCGTICATIRSLSDCLPHAQRCHKTRGEDTHISSLSFALSFKQTDRENERKRNDTNATVVELELQRDKLTRTQPKTHTHTHTYCTTKPLSHSIGCTVWPIH